MKSFKFIQLIYDQLSAHRPLAGRHQLFHAFLREMNFKHMNIFVAERRNILYLEMFIKTESANY